MKLPQRRVSRPNLGGLMATRQGALALALVCAVAATGVLMFALGRYKTAIKAPPTPQTTVLVATKQIAKGTSASTIATGVQYRAMPIVVTQLAPGAISDASVLTGKVAAATILPGQQLTTADFAAVPAVTGALASYQRAISLSISAIPGSTAYLQPGDKVDVYGQFTPKTKNGDIFNVLLERGAPVLSAPNTVAPSGPAAAGAKVVAPATGTPGALVLGVTSARVASVIYAAQNGTLYLALRPSTADHTPNGITTLQTVVAASLADNSTGATK
jgi:Flp pilus assembly protein CpaB